MVITRMVSIHAETACEFAAAAYGEGGPTSTVLKCKLIQAAA